MKITPVAGFLFHEKEHPKLPRHSDLARWRAEMAAINSFLAKTDIDVLAGTPAVSPTDRHLHRIFNQSFDRGGRLYGAFWQWMGKSDRLGRIRINGEPVAEIDFVALFLSLAYGMSRIEPPPGDLYAATEDEPATMPPDAWAAVRKGRKRIVNAMLALPHRRRHWPGKTKEARLQVAEWIGRHPDFTGKPSAEFERMEQRHHAIAADWFWRDQAARLMRTDSDLMVAILLDLSANAGIAGLPVHDSIVVPASHAADAQAAMERVAVEHLGVPLKTAVTVITPLPSANA